MQELTVGQGVENDCDVRSHEGDMCISCSSQVSRTIEEEGAESPESILGRIRVNSIFQAWAYRKTAFMTSQQLWLPVKGLPRVKSVTSSVQRWTGL